MENFRYQNETKIIFGKDTELEVATEVSMYGKNIITLWWWKHKKNWAL